MRSARLAAAAAGVVCDLSASAEGREVMKPISEGAVWMVTASLMIVCQTRGMHSSPAAASELIQLLHDAAAALPALLTPHALAQHNIHDKCVQGTAWCEHMTLAF